MSYSWRHDENYCAHFLKKKSLENPKPWQHVSPTHRIRIKYMPQQQISLNNDEDTTRNGARMWKKWSPGCNLITPISTGGAQHGHWLGDCREKHPNYAGRAQSRTCKFTERETDKERVTGKGGEADSWAVRRKFPQHLHPVASYAIVCVYIAFPFAFSPSLREQMTEWHFDAWMGPGMANKHKDNA